MSLKRYPHLAEISEELTRLSVTETVREPERQRWRSLVSSLGEVHEFLWPGAGEFCLTTPQMRVVDELLEAFAETESAEVGQDHLIRVSGVKARRLSEVFAGSPAWGVLVVPGRAPGTYRLPDLPERGDAA